MSNEIDDLGFVADDDLGFVSDEDSSENKKQYSQGESFLKGAEQGASFGFADELQGLIGAGLEMLPGSSSSADAKLREQGFELPESPSYSSIRDEARQEYEEAEKQNPKSSFAGNIAGGIVTGSALPLGSLPGVQKAAEGAKLALKARLTNAAIQGAGAGTVAGLGTTKDITDPLQVAQDVGVGAVGGALVGPAIELGATGITSGYNSAKKGVSKLTEAIAPTVKAAYSKGVQNPNKSFSDVVQNVVDNFVDVTNQAKEYHSGISKGLKAKESGFNSQILATEAEIVKKNAAQLEAQGRIDEAQKLVSDFSKKIDKLSKENIKLNLEAQSYAQSVQDDLQKAADVEFQKRSKLAEKQYSQNLKQAEKEAKEQTKLLQNQAKEKFEAQTNEVDTQLKQTKVGLRDAQEQFKSAQELAHKNASQEAQNVLRDSSAKLDESLSLHKENLSKSYDNISQELQSSGVSFSGNDVKSKALQMLESDNMLTPQVKEGIKKEIDSLIPDESSYNLSQIKQIVQQLRKQAKSAESSGNNPLASFLNKVASESKEVGYDKITDKNLLSKLRETDKDYANVFKLEDLMENQLQSIKTMKGLLPDTKGVLSAEAQTKAADLQNLAKSNVTQSGQDFASKLQGILDQVTGANEQKLASKFNKDMLKSDNEVQKLQAMLDELNLKKQNLAPEAVEPVTPAQIEKPSIGEKPVIPKQEVMSPSRTSLNEQKMSELQNDILDLSNQINNNRDAITKTGLEKQQLSEQAIELQKKLQEFKQLKEQMTNKDVAGKMLKINNEDDLFNAVASNIRKSEGVDASNVTAKNYVSDLVDQGVIDKSKLENFYKDSDLINALQKPIESGSMTDRSLALRAAPKVANMLGRASGKTSQMIQSAKTYSQADIDLIIKKLMNKGSSEADVFAKQLAESANKDSHSRNAAMFGLMQQPAFRKLLDKEDKEQGN